MKKIALLSLLVFGVFFAAGNSRAEIIFEFASDPGNSIGQGGSFYSADLPGAYGYSVKAGQDRGLHFSFMWYDEAGVVHDGYDGYNLYLRDPNNQRLHVGLYENAQYMMDPSVPEMLFYGDGRFNQYVGGNFQIYMIEYSPDGYPSAISVDFNQYDDWTGPGLYGHLAYNVNGPLPSPVPIPQSFLLLGTGVIGLLALRKRSP